MLFEWLFYWLFQNQSAHLKTSGMGEYAFACVLTVDIQTMSPVCQTLSTSLWPELCDMWHFLMIAIYPLWITRKKLSCSFLKDTEISGYVFYDLLNNRIMTWVICRKLTKYTKCLYWHSLHLSIDSLGQLSVYTLLGPNPWNTKKILAWLFLETKA